MVWYLTFLFTVRDLILIGIAISGIIFLLKLRYQIRFASIRQRGGFIQPSCGPMFIMVGLFLLALFYSLEMIVRYGSIYISNPEYAADFMPRLRDYFHWVIFPVLAGSITTGIVLTGHRIMFIADGLDLSHLRLRNGQARIVLQNEELGKLVHTYTNALTHASEELLESQNTLRDVLDAMPVGVIIKFVDGSTYTNRKLHEIGGREVPRSEEEYEHRLKSMVVLKGTYDPYPLDAVPTQRVIAGETDVHVNDMEFIKSDGSRVQVENWASPVYDKDGNFKAAVSTIVDMSNRERILHELIRAREHAETAAQSQRDFLGNISHKIRTPLTAILGFAQIMKSDPDLASFHHENLAIITQNGRHLLALITEMLSVSNLDSGLVELCETEVDLNKLIRDLDVRFCRHSEAINIRFEIEKAAYLPHYVITDHEKFC